MLRMLKVVTTLVAIEKLGDHIGVAVVVVVVWITKQENWVTRVSKPRVRNAIIHPYICLAA